MRSLLALAIIVTLGAAGCGPQNPEINKQLDANAAKGEEFFKGAQESRQVASDEQFRVIKREAISKVPEEGPIDDDGILRAYKGSDRIYFDKRTVKGKDFPVKVSLIELNLNYDFPAAREVERDIFEYDSSNFEVAVDVALVDASHQKVVTQKGKQIVVDVVAFCAEIKAILPKHAGTVNVRIKKSRPEGATGEVYNIENVQVDWPVGAWQVFVPKENCEGNVDDIHKVVRQEALKELNKAQDAASKELENTIWDLFEKEAEKMKKKARESNAAEKLRKLKERAKRRAAQICASDDTDCRKEEKK